MVQEQEIIQAIADHLGLSVEDLDRHALLREELNLGPIELDELISALAQKFGAKFNPEETEDLRKVDDLIVLVEDNLLE